VAVVVSKGGESLFVGSNSRRGPGEKGLERHAGVWCRIICTKEDQTASGGNGRRPPMKEKGGFSKKAESKRATTMSGITGTRGATLLHY